MAKESKKSDFEILFPGKEIEIEAGTAKLKFKVFPVSVRKMRKFSTAVGRALSVMGTVKIVKGASLEENAGRVLPAVIPVILEDLLELVEDCVVSDPGNAVQISVLDLPYWNVVPVIEAWIRESFIGEGKLRPLVEALERGLSKVSGKKIELWGALSKFSSGQATAEETSSTEDSPGSPIEDGASPSSTST